ncbi:HNH endonuclease [Haloterrigena sp. H1]|uniref:HNH endonuclease n=1 Tax=Haloterrigena sp. H1 TaxID=2552943 RepID=UPI00110E4662|nr:HNH endonuclease [Haloterrigena sp. H1]TMT85449.1 HNH endonuclease [Haloterrigena sp. H1]
MTARDWTADRESVFDRDAFTCRHCETVGDDATTIRLHPVGDVPREGTVHESALVTVCADCLDMLETPSAATAVTAETLFHRVRETTRLQGASISDVATFASLSTSLPATLESARDDGTEADSDDAMSDYRCTRRDVLLSMAVVDAHLEELAVLESAVDSDVRPSLEAFTETAATLQSGLIETVELSETVVAGLERCHGCFDSLEGKTCSTCGLEARETADWRHTSGSIAFDQLFGTINETLQDASETTDTLTDRTTALAERLTA